jgi:hypothetical protein
MKRRKQVSKRRWKARFRMGKYIPFEAVQNHGLGAFVADGVFHSHASMVKRT